MTPKEAIAQDIQRLSAFLAEAKARGFIPEGDVKTLQGMLKRWDSPARIITTPSAPKEGKTDHSKILNGLDAMQKVQK